MKRNALVLFALIACTSACNLPAATSAVPTPEQATVAATLPAPADPPTPLPSATPVLPQTIQVDTLYEGTKTYDCDTGGCWREDGKLEFTPEYYFTGIDRNTPEIQALLDSLGLPSTPAENDKVIWERTMLVWFWLNRNALDEDMSGGQEPWNFLNSISYALRPPKFPSLENLAQVYARYGVIARSGCTDKALDFAMLLYRVGVPVDRMAVVIANWAPSRDVGQHLFVVLRLSGEWYSVDPTCTQVQPYLDSAPERVGCTSADYAHPYGIIVLPGSPLTKPMLVEAMPAP
jgi:hypothetical protein